MAASACRTRTSSSSATASRSEPRSRSSASPSGRDQQRQQREGPAGSRTWFGGDGEMSDHREPTQPAGRLVELVDRFFPLSWIAVYALLPVSGFGASALVSNFDQKRDLEAL